MNSFSVLVHLSGQMYEDIRFIAENNPTQVVDDDTARMFNALLKEIRILKPTQPILKFFNEMSPRTLKYKDALVVIGQLNKLMLLLDTGVDYEEMISRASSSEVPIQTQNDSEKPSPDEQSTDENSEPAEKEEPVDPRISDEELYGSKSVPVNDDGIVPFDLSDS